MSFMSNLKLEKVYSHYHDKFISFNIKDSIIWKSCYHEDELKPDNLWCYHIKFDGLKPVQVTKIEKA